MRSPRLACFASLIVALAAGAASASEMNVAVELPRLDVAEYHRPYVAIWIEREDQGFVANLSVWYEEKNGRGPAGPGGAGGPGGRVGQGSGTGAGGNAGPAGNSGPGGSGPAAG